MKSATFSLTDSGKKLEKEKEEREGKKCGRILRDGESG